MSPSPEVVFFLHESVFEEAARKSNRGEPGNDHSFPVHLLKTIVWEHADLGSDAIKHAYTTDQILDSIKEEEWSQKLSPDIVGDTVIGVAKVSEDKTKTSNLVSKAREFNNFNNPPEEVVIIASEDHVEVVQEYTSDLIIDAMSIVEALDYASDKQTPICH